MRAGKAVQDLIRRPPSAYLVVTHGVFLGAVIRAILGIALDSGRIRPVRIRFDNAGHALLHYEDNVGRWSIERLNVTVHAENEGGEA